MPDRSPRQESSERISRRAVLGGVAVSALLGPSALAAASSRAVAGRVEPPPSPFAWTEVRPGVFASGNIASGSNCLALAGDRGALLVDTKFPAFGTRLDRDVRELTGRPVAWVVNSHHHADHSGGNLAFTADRRVIAHANAKPRILAQVDQNLANATGADRYADRVPEPFRDGIRADAEALRERLGAIRGEAWAPTVTVSAPESGLDLGGVWAEIHHFGRPSHTDNDLVVRVPHHNVLHTGDCVFNGLHPYFDPNGGCSSTDWLDTLADIARLCDAETRVVPGHGPVGTVEIVRAQARYIEQLREAVAAEVDKGTPLDEIKAMVFPFMQGVGFDQLRPNAIEFVRNEIVASR